MLGVERFLDVFLESKVFLFLHGTILFHGNQGRAGWSRLQDEALAAGFAGYLLEQLLLLSLYFFSRLLFLLLVLLAGEGLPQSVANLVKEVGNLFTEGFALTLRQTGYLRSVRLLEIVKVTPIV